jgi:hypothetical protein
LRKLVDCKNFYFRSLTVEDLHSRTGGDETKGKTQERMERRYRKGSASARSEEMERAGDR